MASGLPVSRLINVGVNIAALPSQIQNFNTLLVLDTSNGVDVTTRLRSYGSLDEVAQDFDPSSDAFQAAQLWFAQTPAPTSILVGRWVKTASNGQLFGALIPAAMQLPSAWTGIANGALDITIDGTAKTLTALSFATVGNMNAVASVIQTALAGAATCVWDANFQQIVITSATTGATSTVGFATTAATGTDIGPMLGLTAASGGAFQANGLPPETALQAVEIMDTRFSTQWYGLVIPSAADEDHLAVAGFVEAATVSHYYGVTSQDAAALVATDTTSVGFLLKQLGVKHSACQYSSTSNYAIVSYLARIMTTNWNASNSAITLMFKQEPLITPETLNTDQANNLEAKNINVFVGYNNGVPIIQDGTSASGDFTDTIIGLDVLRATVQNNIFNLLFGVAKVPQTDAGMQLIATQIESACIGASNNGLLGPGNFSGAGFGQIQTGSFLSKGYYIYQPPIASQSQADRAKRKSVPFQVALHLAGAVHTADVILNVG